MRRNLQSEVGTHANVPMTAITALQEEIGSCEKAMLACFASDDELPCCASIIECTSGLGPVNAAYLRADMPPPSWDARRSHPTLAVTKTAVPSGEGVPNPAACSTCWPCRQGIGNRAPRALSIASSLAASPTRWPWWRSCADSSA